jgi:uncharacterized coiled-coil protein SlyX
VSRSLSRSSSIPDSGRSASLEYVKALEERLKNFEKRIDELETTLAEWRKLVTKLETQLQANEMKKGMHTKRTQVESKVLTSEEGRFELEQLREEACLNEQQLTEEAARKATEGEARRKRRADKTRIFSGALNKSRRKEELEDLAAALALSDSGKKDELLERVSNYLEEHPEVKKSPCFEGLFNPRPRKRLRITDAPVPGPSNIHESVPQAPFPPPPFPTWCAFPPGVTPGRSTTCHELVNFPYFRNAYHYPPSQ